MKLAIVGIIKLLLLITVVENYPTKHSILHPLETSPGHSRAWDRTVYHYRHTIAIRDTSRYTIAKHCEVFQLANEIEVEEILKTFPPFTVVPEVGMNEILDVIFSCAEIPDDGVNRTYAYKGKPIYNTPTYLYSNTKWCGPIDIASDYHDLGEYGKEDRCCRALHMCPEYITEVPLDGTIKMRIYHCLCLERYRQCLRMKNTSVSRDLIYEIDLTHKQTCYRVTDN